VAGVAGTCSGAAGGGGGGAVGRIAIRSQGGSMAGIATPGAAQLAF
jgi:hypothetical protein